MGRKRKEKEEQEKIVLRVVLNGTDENPWHKMGLLQNPFPQIAKAEMMQHMEMLNKLGGPPIPPDNAERYIRQTLSGWSQEFTDICVKNYKPGKMVRFTVSFSAKE